MDAKVSPHLSISKYSELDEHTNKIGQVIVLAYVSAPTPVEKALSSSVNGKIPLPPKRFLSRHHK